MSERNASRPTSTCDGGPQIRLLIQACGFRRRRRRVHRLAPRRKAASDPGDEVVVFDSLEQQVHEDARPPYRRTSKLILGAVGDPHCVAERSPTPRRSSTSPRQSASDSPCTRSSATFSQHACDRVVSRARVAERPDLRRDSSSPPRCQSTARASTDCPHPRRASRRARVPTNSSLAAPVGAPLPAPGGGVRAPSRRGESKPLIPTSVYAVNKRDHEELCHVVGSAYGDADGRASLLQRLRSGTGALEPVHRRCCDLLVSFPECKPPLVFEDGQQSRDFIHVSDIVAGILSGARTPTRRSAQSINLGTGRATSVDEVAALLADALGVGLEPERPGSTARATSATAMRTPR